MIEAHIRIMKHPPFYGRKYCLFAYKTPTSTMVSGVCLLGDGIIVWIIPIIFPAMYILI
jgi:Na+-translocating ferredoxin:NAD+ oxidoreductase RnfD subunit